MPSSSHCQNPPVDGSPRPLPAPPLHVRPRRRGRLPPPEAPAGVAGEARPRIRGGGRRARARVPQHAHGRAHRRPPSAWASRYAEKGLAAIDWILRDHRTGDVAHIDPQLLDLLHLLKEQAAGPDSAAAYEVISGFRSERSNEMLRNHSGAVARHSLHLKGMAVDVRLAGVPLLAPARRRARPEEGRRRLLRGRVRPRRHGPRPPLVEIAPCGTRASRRADDAPGCRGGRGRGAALRAAGPRGSAEGLRRRRRRRGGFRRGRAPDLAVIGRTSRVRAPRGRPGRLRALRARRPPARTRPRWRSRT